MGRQAEVLEECDSVLQLSLDTESNYTAVAVATERLQCQLVRRVIFKPEIGHRFNLGVLVEISFKGEVSQCPIGIVGSTGTSRRRGHYRSVSERAD